MIILITKLDRSTWKAKSGEVYEGLKVEGWKQDKEGGAPELWEKFLYDWKDSEWIQAMEQIGIGAAVLIKMTKNGRFWDIEGVEAWRGEAVAGDEEQQPKGNTNEQAAANAQSEATKVPTTPPPVRTATETAGPLVTNFPVQAAAADVMAFDDQAVRSMALKYAVEVTNGMLASDTRFKKLLLVGTTSELLGEILIDFAQRMETFIKGNIGDPASDPQELIKPGKTVGAPVEPDDPGIEPDVDIPF